MVVAWSCHCEATHMHLKSLTFVIRVLGLYSRQTSFSIPAITCSVGCSVDPRSVSAVTLSSSAPRNAFQHSKFPFLVKEKRSSKLILTISLHARSFVYLQNFRLHLLHSMRESQEVLQFLPVPGHPQSVSMRSLVNSPPLPVTNVVF